MTRASPAALTAALTAAGIALAALVVGAPPAYAAGTGAKPAAAPPARLEPAPGSPAAVVDDFLARARAGKLVEAAAALDVPPARSEEAPELARRLRFLLDRRLGHQVAKLSPNPDGDPDDHLPPGVDEIGRVRCEGGAFQPVRLEKQPEPAQPAWRFTRATVEAVDGCYDALPDHAVIDRLPEALLGVGPSGLMWWEWLAAPLLALLSFLVAWPLARVSRVLLRSLARRTTTTHDDAIAKRLGPPLTLAWAAVLFSIAVDVIDPGEVIDGLVARVRGVVLLFSLFWGFFRCADVIEQIVTDSRWARAGGAGGSVARLASRLVKLVVIVLAFVSILSELGYPVASILAGLGIGGLAVALAAQKTFENLFGALALAIDEPFREGDFVHIDDLVGTVEQIGLRSTRLRTLDRTIVSFPNGGLAEKRLETFAVRDRLRLSCTLNLVYETTASQMREILDGLERVLRAHPKIWPDAVVVRFVALNDWALSVDVMAWFLTSDWNEFQTIRQDVLLQFMEVVERAGSAFAFPTQTVHLAPEQAAGSPHPGAS